jgi:hypothetical protein
VRLVQPGGLLDQVQKSRTSDNQGYGLEIISFTRVERFESERLHHDVHVVI